MKTRPTYTIGDFKPQALNAVRMVKDLLRHWGTVMDIRVLYQASDDELIACYRPSESNVWWMLKVIEAGFFEEPVKGLPVLTKYHVRDIETFLANLRNLQSDAWSRTLKGVDHDFAQLWETVWRSYLETHGEEATDRALQELKTEIIEYRRKLRAKRNP